LVSPEGQVSEHLASTQTSPSLHCFPQPPQLLKSIHLLTHLKAGEPVPVSAFKEASEVPPFARHLINPAGQKLLLHAPWWQLLPTWQTFPHLPQCLVFFCRSTQV